MKVYRIEVRPRAATSHHGLLSAAHQLGYPTLIACAVTRLFFLLGDVGEPDVHRLAAQLLADPVTEVYTLGQTPSAAGTLRVERTLLPGVTDPAAESLLKAAHLLGIPLAQAATGERYDLTGELSPEALQRVASGVLSNAVIHRVALGEAISAPFVPAAPPDLTVEVIGVRGLDDDALLALSAERRLSLDIHEMRAIRAYFEAEQRDPTDAELEMLAQTWSEHCVHKTFRAHIRYSGPAHGAPADAPSEVQVVDGLLKTYIRAATEKLAKPWVRSAFVDNAGVMAFDDRYDLAFKVETHNRPSALEPFGGANTGAGGVIRDVLGVSARPIANTDVLCFGLPDTPAASLPDNVLHPRRIIDGVVHGIEDYGNKMGIPTVNGAVHYHAGYTANPLVFAGCVGIVPIGAHRAEAEPGDLIVVMGGRTGRDGLRGATFSSMEMDTTTAQVSGGAVQIGHPIHEKQVMEAVLRARDAGLYTAITDCGAGGLSSAVGEMGQKLGARVQLADVPLKYPGLRPWEIWLSEAQERMVLAVPPRHWEALKAICDAHDVEVVSIGTYEPTGQLELRYGDMPVGSISMDFLHHGIPRRQLEAVWSAPIYDASAPLPAVTVDEALLRLLAQPTIRSKADVIGRYDHEVGTGTAVKPQVGAGSGPADASVIVPQDTLDRPTARAFALSVGMCPQYTAYDPYAMAWAAVDEAVRNAVAVGADPDQLAILDNFSWGNTQLPDRLGALVRCSQGCYDAALAYQTPFISGKDSLNNEYLDQNGVRRAIPGTLVISAIGIMPDAGKAVTSDLKEAGNLLYLLGETRADELAGSAFADLTGYTGGVVPRPVHGALAAYRAVYRAIHAGLVRSAHDPSEGGLAVALAEMCIGGGIGAQLDGQTDAAALFAESQGRLVLEVRPQDAAAFEALLNDAGAPFSRIGQVGGQALLLGEVRVPVESLARAWGAPVRPAPSVPAPVVSPQAAPTLTRTPRVLILHAPGTNRDRDAALACQLAGGDPEVVTVNQLVRGERRLLDYHMLVIPGGFSYGDDLGAGVVWALNLRERIAGVDAFVRGGRPVLGICNGFQTLVKSGLLPGNDWDGGQRKVTLTYNAQGRFECGWVLLQAHPASPCLFTEGLTDPIYCPIAHGEGRVQVADDDTLRRLHADGLAALRYITPDSQHADDFPYNPNGSVDAIAGLCNPAGNVFGLMPHPENHIFPWQHPQHSASQRGYDGLRLFQNGIKRA